MPFEKNHKKAGGRVKGTPNKQTQTLQDMADKLGINPFEVLLLYAGRRWKELGYESEYEVKVGPNGTTIEEARIPPQLQQRSAKDAAEYLYAKRKAVEHSGSIDSRIANELEGLLGLPAEELKRLAEQELKKAKK